MQRDVAWKKLTDAQNEELEGLCSGYIEFLSTCKTERACTAFSIERAREAGYISLAEAREQQRNSGAPLPTGTKLYDVNANKAIMLIQVGSDPLSEGFNILGAHIDSPRLDIKQNPVYESDGMAFLDTHYYGGIKSYQWVTLPLSLQGVVVLKSGKTVEVSVGDAPDDPVFVVTDLLPHLGAEQLQKTGDKLIDAEALDVLVGSKPLILSKEESKAAAEATEEDNASYETKVKAMAAKDAVRAQLLSVLHQKYGIEEEDFLSAELEVVPAGKARDLGFDRSMVLGYGQDDRVCAYTSLLAQLEVEAPKRTSVTILVDKEEIGSVGATGMTSNFFENVIAELMELTGNQGDLNLRRALSRSRMLSSDVSAAYDPAYPSVFESKNTAYAGRGLVFNKFTGARGKSGSNDANAEYMALIRKIMDDAGVAFQTAELGRVNAGGGGTIAYIPAKYGMDVIDSGVPVLSMHSPWEVTSKVDVYMAYAGYKAFLLSE